MKKKNKIFLIGAATVSACAICFGAAIGLASSKQLLAGATGSGQWVHYSRREATPSQLGIREYWVECGGVYQFEAPEGVTPTEKGSDYDLSGFVENDDRYFTYSLTDVYHDFNASLFGASMLKKSDGNYDDVSYRINEKGDSYLHYSLYGDDDVFRINLPRIDYRVYSHVSMKLTCPDWYVNNYFGPEDDDLTYTTVYGGNKNQGKIELFYYDGSLLMKFYDPEYGNLWFTKEYTDSDVINGLASPCFYVTNKWDRYLNLDNITLGCHSDNGNGICSLCGKLIGGSKLVNSAFAAGVETTEKTAAAGFENVYKLTGWSNGNNGSSANIYDKSALYFSLYLNDDGSSTHLKVFQGGDLLTMWNARWYNFLLTKESQDAKWVIKYKEAAASAWTTANINDKSDQNFSSLLTIYNWDARDMTLYCSEVYAK